MLVSLSLRLRKADEKIAGLTFLNASGKVARLLVDFIPELGKRENENALINLPFSRQELSEMSGVSRETLTRVLNKFQDKGFIKIKGQKIVILNEKKLIEAVN